MTLLELFLDASLNEKTCAIPRPGFESYLYFGIKISRDLKTGDIRILNTHKGGSNYEEITPKQYVYFLKHGWIDSIHKIVFQSNEDKISRAKERLGKLSPCRKNDKTIRELSTICENRIEQQKILVKRLEYSK
jgi:hypothetical protein